MKLPALKEIIDERKEKAVENLSVSFAENRLPLEEYERLVEYISKIESERELIVVEKMVAEYGGNDVSGDPSEKVSERTDDKDDEIDYDHSGAGNSLTILSSRTISGPLKSGSQFVSILGTGIIKIRKEDLFKRKTVLNIVAILGDYVIQVEPGIRVINNTIPVLGSSVVDHKVERESQDGGKELIISGAALLGSVTVKLIK